MQTGLNPEANWLENAYELARLAHAAYAESPWEWYPEFETAYPTYVPFSGYRVRGFVLAGTENAVLAFRGVKEDREWMEALTYGQTPMHPGRVHKGLLKVLESVWERVMAGLFDADAINKSLWLTGHSLGGAMVTLGSKKLESIGFEPVMACTFGSPRVLDPVAASALSTPLYRFSNNEDPIPDFPWPSLTETYAHAGRGVYLLPSGAIAEERHSRHLAKQIDRANTIGEGILPAGMIHDHLMKNYLAKLEKLRDQSHAAP